MPEEVRVTVPREWIPEIEGQLADFFEDLELPTTFSVAEGPLRIADRDLSLRDGWTVRKIIHDNRAHLITDALAQRVADEQGFDQSLTLSAVTHLLQELVWHGVRPNRAFHQIASAPHDLEAVFESALDEAGAKIALRVTQEMKNTLLAPGGKESWGDLLNLMNDGLFYELGLPLGSVDLLVDPRVPMGSWRVQINDVRHPVAVGLGPDEFLVNDTVERLRLLNIEARQAVNPANGNECAIIRGEGIAEVCESAGLTTWDVRGFAILSLSAAIRRSAASLLPLFLADFLTKSLAQALPATTRRASEMLTKAEIARVLRWLLREEISVRNLRQILEAMIAVGPPIGADLSKQICFPFPGMDAFRPPNPIETRSISEGVRSALKRELSHKYTRGGNTLVVYLLDPEIESSMAESALDPGFVESFRRAVAQEVGSLPPTTPTPVILTAMNIRARCASILEGDPRGLPVVAYTELSPDMNIQPIARITLE